MLFVANSISEPVQSGVWTEMEVMGSIVLNPCDACCIIQLVCHMLSPLHFEHQLSSYVSSSVFDQGYLPDQAPGGV